MGTTVCCRKDYTVSQDSDLNLYQNLGTEPNTSLSRKASSPNFIKEASGLTTDFNEKIGLDFIEGTFMRDYISILRNQDTTILLNQEDFSVDINRMNKLKNLTFNNIPSILVVKV